MGLWLVEELLKVGLPDAGAFAVQRKSGSDDGCFASLYGTEITDALNTSQVGILCTFAIQAFQ